MNFEDIYEPYLRTKGISFLCSNDEWEECPLEDTPDMPIMKEFLKDNDIQEIRYVSTNLGIVRTWQKVYKSFVKESIQKDSHED